MEALKAKGSNVLKIQTRGGGTGIYFQNCGPVTPLEIILLIHDFQAYLVFLGVTDFWENEKGQKSRQGQTKARESIMSKSYHFFISTGP